MPTTQSRDERLADEARRGQEAYDRFVKPNLHPEDDGKFVAVILDTGEYEIDASAYQAMHRLSARVPGKRGWLFRAGRSTVVRLGLRAPSGGA
jgi:hypothetical protein